MAFKDDLTTRVAEIFRSVWTSRDGIVVPSDTSVTLYNDSVKLDATVLYADLDESTALVDGYSANFAAEIYKSFLHCAAKIIGSAGGQITAYDGDRIMAVFLGTAKNTSAVEAALNLNYARVEIINPAIENQYGAGKYTLRHVVGVDTSPLIVAKTGVRGANDLVWVGRAANHAAKLCALSPDQGHATNITAEVYDRLNEKVTLGPRNEQMWEPFTWEGRTIYRSTWMRSF